MMPKRNIRNLVNVFPQRILPFHQHGKLSEGIYLDYLSGAYVPPIPIIHAPEDLQDLGDYVNYNGHHRTFAARKVGEIRKDFQPQCILLESWKDICYLRDNPPRYSGEIYPELIESLEKSFEAHRDFVWEEARRFQKLIKIAKSKNIVWE